jgi:hypothetical protein
MGQLASGAFDGAGVGMFGGGPRIRGVEFNYDFTKDGGAQGSIVIGSLPAGSIVLHGYVVIDTAITSGGAATAGLSSEAAGDLKATATLISAAPWTGAAGTKTGITPAINTVSTYVVTTAARDVTFVIGVADLTAGAFRLYLLVQGT